MRLYPHMQPSAMCLNPVYPHTMCLNPIMLSHQWRQPITRSSGITPTKVTPWNFNMQSFRESQPTKAHLWISPLYFRDFQPTKASLPGIPTFTCNIQDFQPSFIFQGLSTHQAPLLWLSHHQEPYLGFTLQNHVWEHTTTLDLTIQIHVWEHTTKDFTHPESHLGTHHLGF